MDNKSLVYRELVVRANYILTFVSVLSIFWLKLNVTQICTIIVDPVYNERVDTAKIVH